MKKLNIKTLLLSFAISAVVLFGGWFAMKFIEQQKPITDWVANEKGVKIEELQINHNMIDVQVSFDNKKEFGLFMVKFKQFLETIAEGKQLKLEINPEQSELNPWWLENSAPIIETLYAQEYSQLKGIVEGWKEEGLVKEGNVSMNSQYIFIYLEPTNGKPIYLFLSLDEKMEGGNTI
jgi:hypothetical protein